MLEEVLELARRQNQVVTEKTFADLKQQIALLREDRDHFASLIGELSLLEIKRSHDKPGSQIKVNERFPSTILSQVQETILNRKFIRFQHSMIYRLRVEKASNISPGLEPFEMMVIDAASSYVVQNISDGPADYPVSVIVDNPVFPEFADYTAIRQIMVNDHELITDGLAVQTTTEYKKFSHTVKDVPSGNIIQVQTDFSILKALDDYEVWTTVLPSDGMTMTIHLPKEVKRWDAFSMHPSNILKAVGEGIGTLRIDGPLLPSQGMSIWWRCSR